MSEEIAGAGTPTAAEDTNPQDGVFMDESDLGGTSSETADNTTDNTAVEAAKEKPAEKPTEGGNKNAEGDTNPVVFEFSSGRKANVDRKAMEALSSSLGDDIETIVKTYQKGKNYEYAIDRAVKNSTPAKAIAKLIDDTGMSDDEAIAFITESAPKMAVINEMGRIRGEHPDWDNEKISFAAQNAVSKKQAERIKANKTAEATAQQKREEDEQAGHKAFRALIDELFTEYPDVKAASDKNGKLELSEDEMAMIRDGIKPVTAHRRYLELKARDDKIAELTASMEKFTKKEENKKASPGSAVGEANDIDDPFIQGLSFGR